MQLTAKKVVVYSEDYHGVYHLLGPDHQTCQSRTRKHCNRNYSRAIPLLKVVEEIISRRRYRNICSCWNSQPTYNIHLVRSMRDAYLDGSFSKNADFEVRGHDVPSLGYYPVFVNQRHWSIKSGVEHASQQLWLHRFSIKRYNTQGIITRT
jgi:hypothetical protein